MMARLAAHAFAAAALLAVGFHIALVFGMPWAELSWGGRYSGQLPKPMRVASVASALVLLAMILIVEIRAGVLCPEWLLLSRKLVWGVVAYCALAVIAHVFTPSHWERVAWLPVVLTLFVCSFIVTRS